MSAYKCRDCDVDLPDQAAREAHLEETLEASPERRSHTIAGGKTRERSPEEVEVSSVVNDALDRVLDELQRLVTRGKVSDEEHMTTLLAAYPDFQEAWENYLAEDN